MIEMRRCHLAAAREQWFPMCWPGRRWRQAPLSPSLYMKRSFPRIVSSDTRLPVQNGRELGCGYSWMVSLVKSSVCLARDGSLRATLPRGKSVLPRRREVAPFRQGSKSIPQIQTCERAYRKFGPEDGNLAKTSGLSALGERAPSVATSAQDARCPSRAVAQKCAPPARTSPDHQPRSIDLSNKNRITPTWTIPLSSCCGGLKPDTTTIFRKKSPLARSDAVS